MRREDVSSLKEIAEIIDGGSRTSMIRDLMHVLRLNEMNSEQLAGIFEALKNNQTVHSLYLSKSTIDDDVSAIMANMLQVNTTIVSIRFVHNRITDKGFIALANAISDHISTLDLTNVCINDLRAIALADAIKGNHGIRTLCLNGNQISNVGAIALAGALEVNGSLRDVNFANNQISSVGAIALADAIKGNHGIRTLCLNGNQIGDAGAIALAGALEVNGILQDINLERNQIGDAGAIALAGALEVNGILQDINLETNQICDAGAIALAGALEQNTSLTKLRLAFNSVGDEGARALTEALRISMTLKEIDVYRNNAISREARDSLHEAQGHRVLECTDGTHEIYSILSSSRLPGDVEIDFHAKFPMTAADIKSLCIGGWGNIRLRVKSYAGSLNSVKHDPSLKALQESNKVAFDESSDLNNAMRAFFTLLLHDTVLLHDTTVLLHDTAPPDLFYTTYYASGASGALVGETSEGDNSTI